MLKDNEIKKVKFFDADRWIVGALTVDSSTTYVDNSDKLMEQVESLYSSMMHLEKLVVHMYNSDNKDMCKDELVIQKFKITKSDLQQRNEKCFKFARIVEIRDGSESYIGGGQPIDTNLVKNKLATKIARNMMNNKSVKGKNKLAKARNKSANKKLS
ncbi:hypothetical protein DEO72_LG11g2320 [Vigna unguiculata]|uniref:Uncharacterized protein n=1 Tax=Vigna unguiculata TaxID=3917 RepID=A0A4D6NQW2_VIGUN|nr:hypothetical protein DEO72_LG11g2320 [Vigna unguiculata]